MTALETPRSSSITPTSLPPLVSDRRRVTGHLREFMANSEQLLLRGHREHGDVFTIDLLGKRAVVMLGTEQSRRFLHDPALTTQGSLPHAEKLFSPGFFALGDDDTYHRQKKVLLPLFQGGALGGYVDTMNQEATAFVERLGAAGEFEMIEAFGPLVMQVAARSWLGDQFAQEMPGRDFFAVYRSFSRVDHRPTWLAALDAAVKGQVQEFRDTVAAGRSRELLKTLIGEMFDRRVAAPAPENPDFLHILAKATYSDGTPVERDVAINYVLLLMWAGHETTTGALSWVLADLLQNPVALARARAEAEHALAAGPLDWSAARRLSFIDACLNESQRLHPIPPVLTRVASADLEVDGYVIPAGTVVFASPMATHQLPDPAIANPEVFDPDRFLGEDAKAAKTTLIGFGGGVHRCLGEGFARLEMRVILATLLTSLDMELVGGAPTPVVQAASRWPQSPCTVRYRARTTTTAPASAPGPDAAAATGCPYA